MYIEISVISVDVHNHANKIEKCFNDTRDVFTKDCYERSDIFAGYLESCAGNFSYEIKCEQDDTLTSNLQLPIVHPSDLFVNFQTLSLKSLKTDDFETRDDKQIIWREKKRWAVMQKAPDRKVKLCGEDGKLGR